jgi:hypothetical protein
MVYYYLYMGLLILALILWAIIAVRDDSGGNAQDKR